MNSEMSEAGPILIVTIDIGGNVKDNITINKGESLESVAQSFCDRHNLNPSVKSSIEAYLKDSLSSLPGAEQQVRKKGQHAGVRLYESGVNRLQVREKRAKQLQEKKEREELSSYTFRPQINKNKTASFVIKPEKAKKLPCKSKRETISSKFRECTFSPDINKRSRQIAKDKYEASIERLSRKNSMDRSIEEFSFSPRIGRSPKAERPQNIFQHLHSHSKSSFSQKGLPKNTPEKVLTNHRSTKMMEKIKVNRFIEIFEQFSPQDGVISFETIQRSYIDLEIKTIFVPLFEELEESQETLNLEEFCGALDALLKVLTPEERFKVMFPNKKKQENSQTTPEKKPSHVPDVYNRLVKYKRDTKIKHQQIKMEKDARELDGCTFHPNRKLN